MRTGCAGHWERRDTGAITRETQQKDHDQERKRRALKRLGRHDSSVV
jgi:hypothetical protein